MAINRTPVLKRCRQLGLDPAVLGYSSKKESNRQPKRRRKESEYGMQLREKQKAFSKSSSVATSSVQRLCLVLPVTTLCKFLNLASTM